MSLSATNSASPITSPATSLLVYNTATAGSVPNNVTPGYYYNAGSAASPNWVRLQTKADNDWTVANTTSTPAGKTDNQYVTGNVGIGDFSTSSPASKLHVLGDAFIPDNFSYWIGNNTDAGERLRMHHTGIESYIDFNSGDLTFRTNTTPKIIFKANGDEQINNLAGTGNRNVYADANGVLKAGTINKTIMATYHNFDFSNGGNWSNPSGSNVEYLWFPTAGGDNPDDYKNSGSIGNDYKRVWVAPYNGRLIRIVVRVGNSSGGVELNARIVFDKNGSLSNSTNAVTNLNENQQTTLPLNFSFNQGDRISVGFNSQNDALCPSGDCWIEDTNYYVSLVWEYDVTD